MQNHTCIQYVSTFFRLGSWVHCQGTVSTWWDLSGCRCTEADCWNPCSQCCCLIGAVGTCWWLCSSFYQGLCLGTVGVGSSHGELWEEMVEKLAIISGLSPIIWFSFHSRGNGCDATMMPTGLLLTMPLRFLFWANMQNGQKQQIAILMRSKARMLPKMMKTNSTTLKGNSEYTICSISVPKSCQVAPKNNVTLKWRGMMG